MKLLSVLSFCFLSLSAFAQFKTSINYKIISINKTSKDNYVLFTSTGLPIYADCIRKTLDEVTQDRVSGFGTTQECLDFEKTIQTYLSQNASVTITFEPELKIIVTQ